VFQRILFAFTHFYLLESFNWLSGLWVSIKDWSICTTNHIIPSRSFQNFNCWFWRNILCSETVLPLEYYWTICHLPAESQKSVIKKEHIQLSLDSTDSTQNIYFLYFHQLTKLPVEWRPITTAASTLYVSYITFITVCVGAQRYLWWSVKYRFYTLLCCWIALQGPTI
jgi:hypothetical protein